MDVRALSRLGVSPDDAQALYGVLDGRTVYLASASPRRREILRACGIRYRVIVHSVVEPPPHGPDWRRWVRTWALRKVENAAVGLSHGVVMGADTIVVSGGRGLGKPKDRADAVRMLRSLSGIIHRVYTGVAVLDLRRRRSATASARTDVRFRDLSGNEIAAYVRTREPMDKAGAYGAQGRASRFIARIDGPRDNVVGLPVGCLARVLRRVLV